MNVLAPNFKEQMPEILDSFSEVYGIENEELIRSRENKIIHTMYIDPKEVLNYYDFLKHTITNETAIEYLKRIGVLNKNYNLKKSYQKFSKKIIDLLKKYLDDTFGSKAFTGEEGHNYGISSFNEKATPNNWIKRKNQIKYLNNLRDNKEPQITEENYENFKKTQEFKNLYEIIKNFLKIYEELNSKVSKKLETISYLKDYYNKGIEYKRKLYKLEMLDVYDMLQDDIPEEIKQKLIEKFPDIEKRVDFLLGFNPDTKSKIEYFSSENSDILENSTTKHYEKISIIMDRLFYLKGRIS